MARKTRRKKQSVLTQAQLEGTRQQDLVQTEKIEIEVKAPEPTAKVTVNFEQEYHHVIGDLQRIGILAAVMLVVLVVLNLVLS
jgi:hypothetical protein